MKLYSFSVLFLLVIALTAGAYFTFDKFITSSTDNENNKYLSVGPKFGFYSTIWTVRAKRFNDLIRLADETEINAIVIDVKDGEVYIDDYLKSLVAELHKKNIYAIARIIVFQDSSQIKNHPEWYFKKEDGSLWQDNRSWYWLNPSNRETWDYNVEIAKETIDAGFDEINFDYIRFPAFAKDDDVIISVNGATVLKNRVINDFVVYLTSELRKYDLEVALSVDLFAYNMIDGSDLGVGQVFLELYDYFDYVSPMIYPSHYITGNFGFENPAEHPYEVIFGTLEKGKAQLWEKSAAEVGTTTPAMVNPVFEKRLKKLRPWLQDFNIGAVYNGDMIRKEKQAVYDAGLTSGWLLWNPRNVYTEGALDLDKE
ncbi:MAG: putative glycoside hydrolase [Candidatus Azambacteria bacterium]|nr:putative glycoside hydrolase [Candidatus Azambacteria bacterium]